MKQHNPFSPRPTVNHVVQAEMTVQQMKEEIDQMGIRIEKSARDRIKAGRLLTKIKKAVGPGNLREWLTNNFRWSERTARRLVREYEAWCDKCSGRSEDSMTLDEIDALTEEQSGPVSALKSTETEAESTICGNSPTPTPPTVTPDPLPSVPSGAGDAWEPGSGTPETIPHDDKSGDPDPTDALGNPIPKKLRDVFAGNREGIEAAVKAGFAARKVITGLIQWNSWVRFAELEKTINGVIDDLKNGKPYAVHQDCKGKGCETCRNTGWLTEWKYKELTNA